jgi:hypothetical protein
MSNNDPFRQATTAEQVAFVLMKLVARNEGRSLDHGTSIEGYEPSNREYILDLYADCLEATRGDRHRHATSASISRRSLLSS